MPRLLRAALLAMALAPLSAVGPAASGTADDPVARLGLVPSFDEEFDGAALDKRRWSTPPADDPVDHRSLYGNAERQVYFDAAWLGLGVQPFGFDHGVLSISAAPMSPAVRSVVLANVAALSADKANGPLKNVAYSSGRISTAGRFAQTYGYFEIRVRFPEGKGLWPAFWLLPADGSWPPEIDVVEVIGGEPAVANMTLHSSAAPTDGHKVAIPSSADGFHRYGALWTPQTVDFYLDGAKVASAPTPGDMHKPMYMIANLAVGGYWPGDPDAATKFPARMEIDSIRAWRFARPPSR